LLLSLTPCLRNSVNVIVWLYFNSSVFINYIFDAAPSTVRLPTIVAAITNVVHSMLLAPEKPADFM